MEVIKIRRSVREFTNEDISDSDIKKIIEAGICAPSARNQQPWEFIVVQDEEKIQIFEHVKLVLAVPHSVSVPETL